MSCNNESLFLHKEFASIFNLPKQWDGDRETGLFALRLMYGELIDQNIYEWLKIHNPSQELLDRLKQVNFGLV